MPIYIAWNVFIDVYFEKNVILTQAMFTSRNSLDLRYHIEIADSAEGKIRLR